MTSTRIAPPNSVVLIEDSSGGTIPASMDHTLISATDSCIAVGCKAEDDGETDITLGPCDEVDTGERSAFEWSLQTPNRRLVVRTIHGNTLLEMAVPKTETALRIWVNDPSEPDRVAIGIL